MTVNGYVIHNIRGSDVSGHPLPGLIGPFESGSEAWTAGKRINPRGEWEVLELEHPYTAEMGKMYVIDLEAGDGPLDFGDNNG